jgi:hypothetical protein
MRWAGHVAQMEKRNMYWLLEAKAREKETTRKTKT